MPDIAASIIITTINRCDALIKTLAALGRQTISPDQYEVVVVDDGSSDNTFAAVAKFSLPCRLKVFRHPENRGISAGRNLGIRKASGKYLVFLSDDLIVPENFLQTHLETLEQFPGWWVVGGLEQLPESTQTPFGRYLDSLEKGFDQARRDKPIGPNLWELHWPTARNLSMPRSHLEQIGLFDEQFRIACEEQDLVERARGLGVRFVYNQAITCLHNDQQGDLKRYCRLQRRGSHDTALFCHKYPATHGQSPIARYNSYLSWRDTPSLVIRKLLKGILCQEPSLVLFSNIITLAERLRVPDAWLARMYRFIIGLHIFRGYREGLRTITRYSRPS